MSESEPLMTCRKAEIDAKTGGACVTPGSVQKKPAYWLDGVRHEGGMTLIQALIRNVGTCDSDAKGKVQAEETARTKVLMQGTGAEQLAVPMKQGNACEGKKLHRPALTDWSTRKGRNQ